MIPRFEPTAGTGEILAFLGDVLLTRGRTGLAVSEFERRFARYQGCRHALFIPSGRVGLWLLLKALDYPPGSEIIVPGFTFFAIPAVINFAGLTPVYADIDPGTYELSLESVRALMTPRTRAVIPTHLFGRTCPMSDIERLCGPAKVDLIEDCAQSFGAAVSGVKTGSLGRAAYFTFGITKNFTTFAGGMLACREEEVYQRLVLLRDEFRSASRARLLKEGITALAMRLATQRALFNIFLAPILRCGPSDRPDLVHRAFEEKVRGIDQAAMRMLKWRPLDAQARAGMRQLESLDGKNESRRRLGSELLRLLREAGGGGLPSPAPTGGDHIYMSFAVTRSNRYAFISAARRLGVDVSPGYMSDCAAVPELGGRPGSCPSAAAVEREIVHLPLYPGLGPTDLRKIASAVAAADRAPVTAAVG